MDNTFDKAMDNYEFYLATGGQFHSPEEFETCMKEAEEGYIEQRLYEEYLDEAAAAAEWYERQRWEDTTLDPASEEYLAKQLTGELPIKNGNKLSVVVELFYSDFHISEEFPTKYPEAYNIYKALVDMI